MSYILYENELREAIKIIKDSDIVDSPIMNFIENVLMEHLHKPEHYRVNGFSIEDIREMAHLERYDFSSYTDENLLAEFRPIEKIIEYTQSEEYSDEVLEAINDVVKDLNNRLEDI